MSVFKFKYFEVKQELSAMKVGTDAMLLGALVDVPSDGRALDVGTGTGVIALMLAQKSDNLEIIGLEPDKLAKNEAVFNFRQSKWNDRLKALGCGFEVFSDEQVYDLIVSNPPYYQTNLLNNDERKARARHVIDLTSFVFAEKSNSLLRQDGEVWIIIPSDSENNWLNSFKEFGMFLKKQVFIHGKEKTSPKRSILVFSKEIQTDVIRLNYTVRNSQNQYTDEYVDLTKEFHAIDLKGI